MKQLESRLEDLALKTRLQEPVVLRTLRLTGIDCGLAHALSVLFPGSGVGQPVYVTPDASNMEHIESRVGPKCSLWTSLGAWERRD